MATMLEQDSMIQAAVAEFREEGGITTRVLDRVPGDKLTWKPHEKSMSLGQLALHVATVPGSLARILQQDTFDAAQASFVPPQPKNREEIFAAYDQSLRDAEQFLSALTPQRASGIWHLRKGDKELFSRPRIEVVRSIMLNHWYHHRGQLSVYLRLLEVPVPVIYGRSADEDPFA
ncbi:MAG: DinB family protein [Acidobacteriota bacterium]